MSFIMSWNGSIEQKYIKEAWSLEQPTKLKIQVQEKEYNFKLTRLVFENWKKVLDHQSKLKGGKLGIIIKYFPFPYDEKVFLRDFQAKGISKHNGKSNPWEISFWNWLLANNHYVWFTLN